MKTLAAAIAASMFLIAPISAPSQALAGVPAGLVSRTDWVDQAILAGHDVAHIAEDGVGQRLLLDRGERVVRCLW